MARTKKKTETLARFAALMGLGMSREQICLEMGLHTNEYEATRERFYKELELEHTGKSTLRTFVDYTNRQSKLIRDLEDLKDRLRGKEDKKAENWGSGAGANAFVGAVRVQADIYDRMVSTGQSLELVKKAPKRIEYIGGKAIGEMKTEELEAKIQEELERSQALVDPKESKESGKVIVFYPKMDEDEAAG